MADQLQPVPLITPGFKGLNKTQASVPDLDPGWATECQNFIFDQSGRLASRQGWLKLTTAAIGGAPAIKSMGELYVASSGVTYVVSAANNKIYSGTTALTDITGALTITGDNWQWIPFNGKIYGVQASHPLIQWDGVAASFTTVSAAAAKSFTGSVAAGTGGTGILTVTAITQGILGSGDTFTGTGVTAGTQITGQTGGVTGGIGTYTVNNPTVVASTTMTVASVAVPANGACGVAAFGRLWILNLDNQTISYCALLDATTWFGVGTGSINMTNVWTHGIDAVQGIGAAGSKLVVFGKTHIVILGDDGSSALGLNPQLIRVVDTIEGTGLAARDTIQSTAEGELTFLSPTGVQSLQRLITSGKQNPLATLDPQIRDYFQTYFVNEPVAGIRSAYSPNQRFYVILLPVAGRAFCYDTRQRLQDGSMRVTEWPSVTWTAIVNQKSGTVLVGEKGVVGSYGGYFDNLATYSILYNSPHLALQSVQGTNQQQQNGGGPGGGGVGGGSYENHLKILKRLKAVLYFGGSASVTFSWGVDFQGLNQSLQVPLSGTISEYNIAQYNINEYSGAGLAIIGVPLSRSGRWVQFGLSASISGSQVAIQQLDAFCKIGNMV